MPIYWHQHLILGGFITEARREICFTQLGRTFLLFTFLLWHSYTYSCCTQLSFSQFSPGITHSQLSLTLHNFAKHTFASAQLLYETLIFNVWLSTTNIWNQNSWMSNLKYVRLKVSAAELSLGSTKLSQNCVRLTYVQQNWVQAKSCQVKTQQGWTIPVKTKLKQKCPIWNVSVSNVKNRNRSSPSQNVLWDPLRLWLNSKIRQSKINSHWADWTNKSSTKRLMFQVLFF